MDERMRKEKDSLVTLCLNRFWLFQLSFLFLNKKWNFAAELVTFYFRFASGNDGRSVSSVVDEQRRPVTKQTFKLKRVTWGAENYKTQVRAKCVFSAGKMSWNIVPS